VNVVSEVVAGHLLRGSIDRPIPPPLGLVDLLRLEHLRQILTSAVVVEARFGGDGLGRAAIRMGIKPFKDSLATLGEWRRAAPSA